MGLKGRGGKERTHKPGQIVILQPESCFQKNCITSICLHRPSKPPVCYGFLLLCSIFFLISDGQGHRRQIWEKFAFFDQILLYPPPPPFPPLFFSFFLSLFCFLTGGDSLAALNHSRGGKTERGGGGKGEKGGGGGKNQGCT